MSEMKAGGEENLWRVAAVVGAGECGYPGVSGRSLEPSGSQSIGRASSHAPGSQSLSNSSSASSVNISLLEDMVRNYRKSYSHLRVFFWGGG